VDIFENKIDTENLIYTTQEISNSYKRTILKKGDLVFPLRGKIGTVGLINDELVGANLTRGVALIALKKSNPIFLKQLFGSNRILKQLYSSMNGSALQEITIDTLKKFKVVMPDLIEQQKIATALSDTDALISELEKLIEKKQAIKTATMQQLLTGKTRLPEFALREDGTPKGYKDSELGQIPEDWELLSFSEVCTFINGRAYGLHEWEKRGTPVIRLQNLTGRGGDYYYSTLNLPAKQYCDYGDLLFMWSATFGPVIWKGQKAIYHYHIWKIVCNENVDKDFLYLTLEDMTENLKRGSSSGGTMLHVTKEIMESTLAIFPPHAEQLRIASVLNGIIQEIELLVEKLNKLKNIKQGMMQELLTGKTRLV